MKIRLILFILVIIFTVFCSSCKVEEKSSKLGIVKLVFGKSILEREGKKRPVVIGDFFAKGDNIITGADGIVIAVIGKGGSEVEIQNNSKFSIDEYSAKNKVFSLRKGNIWMRVKKISKKENVILHSPTTIAGVRGTKFFTFDIGGIHGTCVCQGKVELELKDKSFHKTHDKDYVMFTRGGKTIVLTPLDFGGPLGEHKHSLMSNSPLGPQANAVEFKRVMKDGRKEI